MNHIITSDECESAKGNITVPVGLVETVRGYMDESGLSRFLKGLKTKGVDMVALTEMLVVHSLSEDNSMSACARWLKDPRVRSLFGVKGNVSQKTLNRALVTLGDNREGIVLELYRGLKRMFPECSTDIDADGSSVSMNSKGGLADYGYPRDGNPDGLQVEFMLGMFEDSRIPFYIDAFKGNVSDEEQYARALPEMLGIMDEDDIDAYREISDRLVSGIRLRNEEKELAKKPGKKGKRGRKSKQATGANEDRSYPLLMLRRALGNVSWVIFDNGGASVYNTDAVNEMGHEYLTRKKMNKSDLELVARTQPVQVEPGLQCWCETFKESGRTKYIFKADYLEEAKTQAADRKVRRMAEVAKALANGEIEPDSLVERKRNEFITFDVKVTVQQILTDYSDEELEVLKRRFRGDYCGFFHLESSFPLTPLEAIHKYRKRVAIEHAIRALKNVAMIKPMRVWKDESVIGQLVLALLAQAVVAMARYEFPEDLVKVTKGGTTTVKTHRPDCNSICRMLVHLTATFYTDEHRRVRRVLSGVTEQSIGILRRIEARTGRNTLDRLCLHGSSAVETA